MDILKLSHYLDDLLNVPHIPDAPKALNGLQVENTGNIQKIGLAVDIPILSCRLQGVTLQFHESYKPFGTIAARKRLTFNTGMHP